MKTFSLTIISDTKLIFKGKALYCGVTTLTGSLGLEAFHEPLLGILKDNSEINYTVKSGGQSSVAVENGMFSFKNNTCTITVQIKVKDK